MNIRVSNLAIVEEAMSLRPYCRTSVPLVQDALSPQAPQHPP